MLFVSNVFSISSGFATIRDQRSESVKDMLNDGCDEIRDYQKKSNCLKAIHTFFDDGF